MKRRVMILSILLFSLIAWGCDDDSGSSTDSKGTSSGTANEIDASIEGGDSAGSISGESAESQEGFYQASVSNGEVIVYLAGANADLIFFKVDSTQVTLPGSASVARGLDAPAFLSYTIGAVINEGSGGSIKIDNCPNDVGVVVTGSFNGVELTNVISDSPNGVLSGNFRATVVSSDGSAVCAAVVETGGPSPGASCSNDTCEGPCCPYVEPISICQISCSTNACMNPTDILGCIECHNQCITDSGILEDQVCVDASAVLDQCMQKHSCDSGELFGENECVATNCCSEYSAAF